jgi:threonine dehydrogenase-like Zn-dependent dehydrogenase
MDRVSWEQAGALFVAGTTAYAAVRSVALHAGDTVIVSGAAGGVGSIAVQLARDAGAKVIGLAGDAHHKWLTDHGVLPITYGDGVEDRIRAACAGKVDAFIDTFGGGYVELALKLGVAPNRIDTIIQRCRVAAAELPDALVYAGSPVMPAQMLAPRSEGSLAVSCVRPHFGVRITLAGKRSASDPRDGGRRNLCQGG